MKIDRKWAMPSRNTLNIKPIYEWAEPYLVDATMSIDPFARNCELADVTNDLNPDTDAKWHKPANEFLKLFDNADLVIFDPPYSLRQVKECYENYGVGFTQKDSQNAIRWTVERDIIAKNQRKGEVVLSFGWTSTCMGKKRGYEIESILLVSHGPAHNDTICVAERKR